MSRHPPGPAWLAFAVLGIAGCVGMDPVEDRVLSTRYEQRFTDEAIRRDWAAMDALRARIDAARRSHGASYALWRAELELDLAVDEYQENDRTTLADALLDDSRRLVSGIERSPPGGDDLALPELPAVKRVRVDLWTEVERTKGDVSLLECAGEHVARLEAGLLELGHDQWEVDAGLNSADHVEPCPLVPLVDDLAASLREAVAACRKPPPPRVEKIVLGAEALFRFDRCRADDMLPEGLARLDELGASLAGEPQSWVHLVITGHTDRLGRHAHNLPLSRCRAETVRDYLVQRHGLPAERIETRGLASTQPIRFCTGPVDDALKACLQPNRRVEIEVQR